MNIEHKTHPVEHWIVDGKAYRLATEADIGKPVSSTDHALKKGGSHNAVGKLNGVDRTTDLPFSSRGTYWRYAYIQDDSLLDSKRVPVEPTIDWTKPVRTKDGRAVRVLCTDGPGNYPVVGFIGDDLEIWTIDGAFCENESGPGDIENIPPEPKRIRIERWANVYDENGDELYFWRSKEQADRYAKNDRSRLACVKIVIDAAEGEGL